MIAGPIIAGGGSAGIPTTSYANAGGTGDRTASVTVTFTPLTGTPSNGGTANNLVDGAFAGNSSDAFGFPSMSLVDGETFLFVFGSKKYVDEITLYIDRAVSWGIWKVQAGDGIGAWTDLASFNWAGDTQIVPLSGIAPAGYTNYRFLKVGATASNGPWFLEVEFKIAPGA